MRSYLATCSRKGNYTDGEFRKRFEFTKRPHLAAAGFGGAAVNCQIGLTVAVQIEPSDSKGPLDRLFADGRGDHSSLPVSLPGETDVNRGDPHR